MLRRVDWKTSADISEEPATSMFRVEDGGNGFIRNVGTYLPAYMALCTNDRNFEIDANNSWPLP
jgi:hypothetical protein